MRPRTNHGQFTDLLNVGQPEAALRFLQNHPELADVNAGGADFFYEAISLVDSPELVREFLKHFPTRGKLGAMGTNVFTIAVDSNHPKSLSVLLECAEGVMERDYYEALIEACVKRKPDQSYACAQLLAKAGALSARNTEGRTVTDKWFSVPPRETSDTRDMDMWGASLLCRMALGGDARGWIESEKKSVIPGWEEDIPGAVLATNNVIAAQEERLAACMKKMSPTMLLKKFAVEPTGWPAPEQAKPGAAETLKPAEVNSLQHELYALLSAGRTEVLAAPEYWAKQQMPAMKFAAKVDAMLPDYLDHLRGRIYSPTLLRQQGTPHADSVLVEYMRAGVAREPGR